MACNSEFLAVLVARLWGLCSACIVPTPLQSIFRPVVRGFAVIVRCPIEHFRVPRRCCSCSSTIFANGPRPEAG